MAAGFPVERIADAIATAQGYDLTSTPDLKPALEDAVKNAYWRAVADFEQRIAGSDLVDIFEQELQLDIVDRLSQLQTRLQTLQRTSSSYSRRR